MNLCSPWNQEHTWVCKTRAEIRTEQLRPAKNYCRRTYGEVQEGTASVRYYDSRMEPESRSRIMRAIRSKGNMSTEVRFASLLREAHLTGWRRHQHLPGCPDFVFRPQRLAIFIDGCFWHACPQCSQPPRENTGYWGPKLARNKQRDAEVNAELRARRWRVIRIWEHQLDRPSSVLKALQRKLNS